MTWWDPPSLISDEGCCWFADSCRKAHLIWFEQREEWDWEVTVSSGAWRPLKRWVAANGPQLPLQRSFANWEWQEDGADYVWRLRFVMAAEEDFGEEHEVFGMVSRDGAEIVFENGCMWSRAGDLLREVSNQAMLDLWDNYAVTPGWPCGSHAAEAAQRIRDHGFVVLPNVLSNEQCEDLLRACQEMEDDFLRLDRHRQGNRGPGRYSFGFARRHCFRPCEARHEWASVAALPAVVCVLEELLSPEFLCLSLGGDFVLPGTAQGQQLHSDLFNWPEAADDANFGGRPPFISVNFAVRPIYDRDGPIRILPGTHRWSDGDAHSNELWAELPLQAGLAPLPTGTAILRDVRTWHGGTPNLGRLSRYLPSCEYVPPEYLDVLRSGSTDDWWNDRAYHHEPRRKMPQEVFELLNPVGQHVCRYLVET